MADRQASRYGAVRPTVSCRSRSRGTASSGRSILDQGSISVEDLASEPDSECGCVANRLVLASAIARSLASPCCERAAPSARSGHAPQRAEGHSPTSRSSCCKTFADQAVIAIENVRLFKELQARTQELARSVEQLGSLSEVSQAVNSTLDLQEVLSTIVTHAVQLSATDGGAIYEADEELGRVPAASHLWTAGGVWSRSCALRRCSRARGRQGRQPRHARPSRSPTCARTMPTPSRGGSSA